MKHDGAKKPYPEVEPSPDFPRLELAVLERWRKQRIFERSVEQRPAGRAARPVAHEAEARNHDRSINPVSGLEACAWSRRAIRPAS